ncbi:MAG: sugar transferase [Fusicatenibacter sp.]|nr:sugar transferase [Fusicatenibacter sp.]
MYERKQKLQNIILMAIDAACLVVSYLLASCFSLYLRPNTLQITMHDVVGSLWIVFLAYFCVFIFFNMNQYLLQRDAYEEMVYVIKVNVFVAAVLAVVFYAAKYIWLLPRGVWIFTVLLNLVFMYAGHIAAKKILIARFCSGPKQHIYLVTTSDRVEKVLNQLSMSEDYASYAISIGILDEDMRDQMILGFPVVADRESLFEFARTQIVDEVYINVPNGDQRFVENCIRGFEEMGITVHLNISVLEGHDGFCKQIGMIGQYPVVSFAPRFYDYNKLVMKRLIDIAGAIVGLLITGAVTVFLAPAIKLESPGPLFFKQKRVGRNGRFFYIYKFRSMYQDAEERKAALMERNEMKGAMFKVTDDPRITKVGKFIRATSLDELPQFWNILKGEMSLVGTRPPTVDEFQAYEAHHKRRLSMKPGLTGMWQVSGRSNIADFEEVVRLDCYYLDHWSLQLDAKILLKTIVVVIKKVGSK